MTTVTESSTHVPPPLSIGDKCMVRWRDGSETLLGKVIERRAPKKRKQDGTQQSENKDEFEYYVHYESHDRRLDEWIPLSKFLLETYEAKSEELEAPQEEAARPQRRVATEHAPIRLTGGNWHASGDPTLAELEREHEEITKVKNISKIIMGGWEVEAWYFSPYPEDYANCETLFICEYCLKYMKSVRTFHKHKACCEARKPPGNEIYRHDNISAFEVDGKESKVYCQNLCLLAKLFLDHKTLYFDTDPFLFYVICQVDEYGAHIVGYFSKEKVSAEDYNLACILTFPQHQKCGYGKFIISLSYELTKREETTGSPEKPLSDLGKISYRSYWTHVLFGLLKKGPSQELTIKAMSRQTGIKQEDIISTLQSLGMIKCFRSQHVIFVQQQILDEYKKADSDFLFCDPKYLKWEPPSKKN
jgi:histone acetyltransferase MYST1